MKLYCVYDCVSEEFLSPWPARNSKSASSIVAKSLADSGGYSTDFELYEVGDFYPDSPTFNNVVTGYQPLLITNFSDIVKDFRRVFPALDEKFPQE